MARADVRKPETDAARQAVGRVVERAREISGLNLQQFAARLQRDERQVARWITATERAQLDAFVADVKLHQSFIQANAELAGAGVDVMTSITLRRIA